jgi:hypothetical protein
MCALTHTITRASDRTSHSSNKLNSLPYPTHFFRILVELEISYVMAGKFEPKTPVQLNPPKDDLISPEYLAKCNGMIQPSLEIVMKTALRWKLTSRKVPMVTRAM